MRLPRALAPAVLLLVASAARGGAFAPGEETVFQVRFLNVPTGEGRILVGQAEGDVWPVIFQVRTGGAASLIDIREHLVTYWDSSASLTRGSDLRAYEIGDYHVDSARFDRVNGQATVSVHRKGRRKVETFSVSPGVQDLTSAFMWLRLQPLAPGRHLELPVCAGRKQFTLVADVLGREVVGTPAGSFQTVKVKVRTALDGKFSTRRDTFMWLSDDARHVLVRASADFAVGSMVATLKTYRPGNELASR